MSLSILDSHCSTLDALFCKPLTTSTMLKAASWKMSLSISVVHVLEHDLDRRSPHQQAPSFPTSFTTHSSVVHTVMKNNGTIVNNTSVGE